MQVEDDPPLKQRPLVSDQKGQYHFVFPLRPGDTRFAVVYQLPYEGEELIQPIIRNPLEKFVVMLPKSMQFEPKDAGIFKPMRGTTPDNVQGTAPVELGENLAFRVSGTGTLLELADRRQQKQETTSESALPGPGGGLGPPVDAPDPLKPYRWQVLAGVAILMLGCAAYVSRMGDKLVQVRDLEELCKTRLRNSRPQLHVRKSSGRQKRSR